MCSALEELWHDELEAAKEKMREDIREEVLAEVRAEVQAEVRAEVQAELQAENQLYLISLVQRKVKRNSPLVLIAQELEETPDSICNIYDTVMAHPDADKETIYRYLHPVDMSKN
ncbi:hypothetical protein AALA00_11490 [Lachnospiraceae bacterium 46-15]